MRVFRRFEEWEGKGRRVEGKPGTVFFAGACAQKGLGGCECGQDTACCLQTHGTSRAHFGALVGCVATQIILPAVHSDDGDSGQESHRPGPWSFTTPVPSRTVSSRAA